MALELGRVTRALKRRSRMLIAFVAVGAGLGVVGAFTVASRKYESRSVLQWERVKAMGSSDEGREFQTMVDSVKLPVIMEEVRSRLKIHASIEELAARVDVISTSESNILSLKGTASDPIAAANLTAAVTEAFIDHRVAVERKRRGEIVAMATTEVENARKDVDKARKEYDDFRLEHHIADLPAETQAAIEKVARLRAEADVAHAEEAAEKARIDTLNHVMKEEPAKEIVKETKVLADAKKLVEVRSDLVTLSAQLAGDHPKVRALEAEIAELERHRAEHPDPEPTERMVGPNPRWELAAQNLTMAGAQRDAARRRQDTFTELAKSAEGKIAELARLSGEASAKAASLRVAEQHLADLLTALATARDSERSAVSDFRVLAPAKPPPLPSKSTRRWVALGGPLAGLLLGVAWTLYTVIRGLRVFTGRELGFWGRAPVVASSTWPREAGAAGDLVDDIDLLWRRSRGVTLILGLGPAEAPHAATLAAALEARRSAGDPRQIVVLPAGLTVQAMRRAAREASRVLVLVESGRHSAIDLSSVAGDIGRAEGLGFALLNLGADLAGFPDRAGDVDEFWTTDGAPSASPSRPPVEATV